MKQRRFVPKAEYARQTGLSYATITHMANTGQIKTIVTESGQMRIDTQESNAYDPNVLERLDGQEKLLKSLCTHLGVKI